MGAYTVGEATKERILQSCRRLFYAKGLKGTSYDAICEMAEINRGLVPYHFKSKKNLAITIFMQFMDDFEAIMREEIMVKNFNVYFIVTELLLFRLVAANTNLCRFYNEIETADDFTEDTMYLQRRIINEIVCYNDLQKFTEDELRTLCCMFEGVETEIIRNLSTGYLTEPIDKIVERDIYFVFSQLGFPRQQIAAYFAEAFRIAARYQLQIDDKFQVFLEKIAD